jgi:hypothetical protein
MRIARETNTPLHAWTGAMRVLAPDGRPIEPVSRTDALFELTWELFADGMRVAREAYKPERRAKGPHAVSTISKDRSLLDHVRERAAAVVDDEKERQLVEMMAEGWGAYIGAEVGRQSLRFAWLEECCDGGAWGLLVVVTSCTVLTQTPAKTS